MLRISARTAAASSRVSLSLMATSHPAMASLWAIARPIPREAPVTSAIFPVKGPAVFRSRRLVDMPGTKTWRVYPDAHGTSIVWHGYVRFPETSRETRCAGVRSSSIAGGGISAAGQCVEVPQEEVHQSGHLRIGE